MSNVVAFPRSSVPRWRAEVVYRSDLGPLEIVHVFEEIEDLAALIEHGPDWRCMVSCEITLNRSGKEFATLTIEQAAKL
ncbi:hypothetical protein FJ973_05865 [Mesorhizobium sp. B2-1-3]|uniref:hypothetical protein n=1 Tax=Mesorhizobium sp. B2-1-3 TaxID=2589972 RepID=UPI00112A909B|nr:hypothetical protein [Mesorhizobium sp. B2-1-3]TPN16216.1 hypothetical protein FJ973_05865 [Mesorhizobium sp. B2-1-3]